MRINEQVSASHGFGGAFVPVKGGITRTEPSALTSTFKS
jgi:hypothetical protein